MSKTEGTTKDYQYYPYQSQDELAITILRISSLVVVLEIEAERNLDRADKLFSRIILQARTYISDEGTSKSYIYNYFAIL